MCSRDFGPAREPSLVMCPMRKEETLFFLATRKISFAADLDLLQRLLAGDVENPFTQDGEIPADLEKQSGFSDPRLTADQDQGAEDDAPAQNLVEFISRDPDPLLGDFLDIPVEERLRRREGIFGRRDRVLGLLDHGVPFAAARTAAQPFGRSGPAGLADEDPLQLVLHLGPGPTPE